MKKVKNALSKVKLSKLPKAKVSIKKPKKPKMDKMSMKSFVDQRNSGMI
jgi:hypothetical protein